MKPKTFWMNQIYWKRMKNKDNSKEIKFYADALIGFREPSHYCKEDLNVDYK
jgi:hypothetical protein